MATTTNKQPRRYPKQVRGLNFYDIDKNLQTFLSRHAVDLLDNEQTTLSDLGAFAGDRLDRQAEETDQSFPPQLRDVPDSMSKPTGRKNILRINPEYEDCQQELYRRGLVAKCFDEKNPRSHILPFVAQYLVSQSDISTGCPFAMTHPVAYVLDTVAPNEVKEKFLPEILRTDGQTAICGTWATERHSGSDVGGSVTKASDKGLKKLSMIFDQKLESFARTLTGHNWFTSAFGFKKFMAIKTARPKGAPDGVKGLGLYLVPSHIDESWSAPNNYTITHLKRKLGTKGLPTVEVDLNDTVAYEIAPEGRGIHGMMAALGCSRVHNAMGAAGVMHRAYLETLCWMENRETFGKALTERPMMQKRVLDIATEWMAGSALAFEAAKSFDETTRQPDKAQWMRIVTALAKFKTAEQAVWCAEKALEAVGGNGYTEDYPVSRLYRDAMVLRVWEGPEQIQALELMRMIAGKETGGQLFVKKLRDVAADLSDDMADQKARLMHLLHGVDQALQKLQAEPEQTEAVADEFLHYMADVLAYGLLCEEASWEVENKNDKTKSLIVDNYYNRTFEGAKPPMSSKPDLYKSFNEIARGLPVLAKDQRQSSFPVPPRPGAWR